MDSIIGQPISLRDSKVFDDSTMAQLWDFYVTKSTSSCQERKLSEYGTEPSYDALVRIAGGERRSCRLLKASSMNKTLQALGFYERIDGKDPTPRSSISIDFPRWCALQNFEIRDDEPPRAKAGDNDVQCLLRHVRNGMAHGLTFLLDNGMVLIRDKDQRQTAWILIRASTLVDWVKYIDINAKFYFTEDDREDIKQILAMDKRKGKR